MKTANANTPFFTLHADFDGCHWLSGILGDVSATEFAQDVIDNGKGRVVDGLADYLANSDGYWTDRKQAEEALEESSIRFTGSVKEFTPAEAIDTILKMAAG